MGGSELRFSSSSRSRRPVRSCTSTRACSALAHSLCMKASIAADRLRLAAANSSISRCQPWRTFLSCNVRSGKENAEQALLLPTPTRLGGSGKDAPQANGQRHRTETKEAHAEEGWRAEAGIQPPRQQDQTRSRQADADSAVDGLGSFAASCLGTVRTITCMQARCSRCEGEPT